MAKIRMLLDTKFTKSCPSIVAIVFSVIPMPKPLIRAFLRSYSSVAILGQILPIPTNFDQKKAVHGGPDKF